MAHTFTISGWPAHEILSFITYAQKPPLNPNVDISSRASRGLIFGLSLHLHFVYLLGYLTM